MAAELDKWTEQYFEFHRQVMEFESPILKDVKAGARGRGVFWPPLVNLYRAGGWVTALALREKQVPPEQLRAFEKAHRTFHRTRAPSDYFAWYVKNRDSIRLLLDVPEWPDKGAAAERALVVNGFVLHNQTTGDPTATVEELRHSTDLLERTGLPRIGEIFYGDVYIVGEIERKKSVAARYDGERDQVFLVRVPRHEAAYEHAIMHELGHRYWQRFMTDEQRRAWTKHHNELAGVARFGRTAQVGFPIVGERLDFVVGKPRVVGYHGQRIMVETDDGRVGYVGLQAYQNVELKRRQREQFPTAYSATDPQEHFCEALALYAAGKLGAEHAQALEETLDMRADNPSDRSDRERFASLLRGW